MYVDDFTLINWLDIQELNKINKETLYIAENWYKFNNRSLNRGKTQQTIISNRFKYDSRKSVKLLGIHIDSDMNGQVIYRFYARNLHHWLFFLEN